MGSMFLSLDLGLGIVFHPPRFHVPHVLGVLLASQNCSQILDAFSVSLFLPGFFVSSSLSLFQVLL